MTNVYSDPSIARSNAEALGQKAHGGIDRLSAGAHDAVDRAADVATAAAERFGARGKDLFAAGDQWMTAARDSVRDHPIAAVGVAVALGYLLSRIMSR
jgi:ElaB/YqjD/DUF883 family membrane-anchored ribosome-binding protein